MDLSYPVLNLWLITFILLGCVFYNTKKKKQVEGLYLNDHFLLYIITLCLALLINFITYSLI